MFDLYINKGTINVSKNVVHEAEELIAEGFSDVFIYEMNCVLQRSQRFVEYSFHLKNSILKESLIKITVDEKDNITDYQCRYCSEFVVCKHVCAAILMYEKKKEEQERTNLLEYQKQKQILINKFLVLEEENRKKIYESRRKKSLEEMNRILNEIHSADTLLLATPVHLQGVLDLSYSPCLRLKIGQEKMYVVQNINKFLDAVYNNIDMTYGKNFCFNHTINNFDDESQELIRYLLSINAAPEESKNIYLTKTRVDKIIDMFTNKMLEIRNVVNGAETEENYYVSLAETSVSLNLDKNYNLSIKKKENTNILFGYYNDYLLEEREIKKIVYNDPTLRIMVKHLNEKEESYETIKDVFRDEIYPRLHKYIEIPDSLREELKLVDYNINIYFDIIDSILEYKIKYLCNNVEVDIEEMSVVSFKLNKCNNFLKNLGFTDSGKIGEMVDIVKFLRCDLGELRKIADVYLSENVKGMQIKTCSKISSHLNYNTSMLDICFEKSEFSDEELSKIIKSLRKKVRYIKLNKNTIIEVDERTAAKLLNTVNEFNLDIDNLTSPQEIPLYQSLKLADKDLNIVDYKLSDSLKSLLKEISGYKKAQFSIPEHLKDIMRPYQKEAFQWLNTLAKYEFCGILADDMGLGKTLEIISVLCSDKSNAPILIVCPKSLCYNWRNEFSLWGDEFEVINIIGSGLERKHIIDDIDNNKRIVYISSYDSLRNDIDYYSEKIFRYLILDEAQSIKNHDTLKAKSVKMINSKLRYVLTGTPIENTIIDLWSIFDFLMPGYLNNYSGFKGRYERAIVERKDEDLITNLVKKITPFVLRRTKNDVLKDLPSKVEFIRMATMESAQKKIYDAQLKKTRDILTSDKDNKILILSCLTRLRQICVDPGLFIDDYDGGSCKSDLLMEILEEYIAEGHKIVLFSQFVSIFERLGKIFDKSLIKYYVLTGKTSAFDRVTLANEFNSPENDTKVFLVSLKAGGTGLNLIGADVVIHLDPWWNYAVENQATDRTHRIGQTKSVSVIKLIVENSIEQKVIELQKLKKDIADRIISSDNSNIENLVIDDVKYLLD